jgi:MoxR-like ATPase
VSGREYVVPEDVKEVAPAVLSHRLIAAPEARSAGLDTPELVRDLVDRTPVPI